MRLEPVHSDIPFLIIHDLYDQDELYLINVELEFLYRSGTFVEDSAKKTNAAFKEGRLLKKAGGTWLDSFYADRLSSIILQLNRKPFVDSEIVETFTDLHPYHQPYSLCNHDSTLINYYENSDYYQAHYDEASFSVVTWLFNEPKQFTGGNLLFVDIDHKIEIKNNMAVIFPSFLRHEVEEIKLNPNAPQNSGRYSIAQFLKFGKI